MQQSAARAAVSRKKQDAGYSLEISSIHRRSAHKLMSAHVSTKHFECANHACLTSMQQVASCGACGACSAYLGIGWWQWNVSVCYKDNFSYSRKVWRPARTVLMMGFCTLKVLDVRCISKRLYSHRNNEIHISVSMPLLGPSKARLQWLSTLDRQSEVKHQPCLKSALIVT